MAKVPPSSRPPSRSAEKPSTATTRRPREAAQKLKAVKVLQAGGAKGVGAAQGGGAEEEGGGEAAGGAHHSELGEGHAQLAEQALGGETATQEAKEESKEVLAELREEEERAEAAEGEGETVSGRSTPPKQSNVEGKKNKPGALKHEELEDGFGKTRMDSLRESLTKLESAQKVAPGTQMLPSARKQGTDALSALNNAQDPGVYFKEKGSNGGAEEVEDPELAEAVAEAKLKLADVKGVERVAPGEDEDRQPVVLVIATRGFTQGSLAQVPEKVRRFATLLAVPYDLLPLRRAEP
ncbi:MAG: hypothetical protein ACT4TC_25510 [Myxococcaceae bacterium]